MKISIVKQVFFVIIIIFVFVFCSSCTSIDLTSNITQENSSRSKEYNPKKNAKKEAEVYFEYLKEKDIQSLSNLFSSKIKSTHNLEKEWISFFNAINGNIVSYKKISIHDEEMCIDDHMVTFSGLTVRFENVQTDTGKVYEMIDYHEIRVDTKYPDTEGISLFSVKLSSDSDVDKSNNKVIIGG